jgi:hypothetical protein
VTWPKRGMTRNGYAFELPTSAPLTAGSGCSSSPSDEGWLLPTPRVTSERNSRKAMVENRQWSGLSLAQAVEVASGILPREFESWDEVPGTLGRTMRGEEPLLPTPAAQEPGFRHRTPVTKDGQTPEHGAQRWYDQETGRVMQKGLTQVVALLPTPGAHDATGAELETRSRRQEEGKTGGPSLRDLPRLLPTPGTRDHHAQGAGHNPTARSSSLATTVQKGKLLPTPTTQDAANTAGPSQQARNSDPLNVVAAKAGERLLPTPVANPDNPGAGGELRAALTHGEGRRNETGTDTMGRPNTGRPSRKEASAPADAPGTTSTPTDSAPAATPTSTTPEASTPSSPSPATTGPARLLPTPQRSDGTGGRVERTAMRSGGKRPSGQKATLTLGTAIELSGELTSRPFADGDTPSDGTHPDQLTIEDG